MFIKKLFLIRHSKSSWKHPGMSDHDRPLNKRGKYDAPFMAEKLYQLEIFPDLILSSTAVRTLEFANILADKLNYEKENIISLRELYLASDSEIIKTVRETDDKYKTVFLVAHNPGITYAVNNLSGSGIDNMPTSGIAGIEFKTDTWKEIKSGSGNLFLFEFPKKYYP